MDLADQRRHVRVPSLALTAAVVNDLTLNDSSLPNLMILYTLVAANFCHSVLKNYNTCIPMHWKSLPNGVFSF